MSKTTTIRNNDDDDEKEEEEGTFAVGSNLVDITCFIALVTDFTVVGVVANSAVDTVYVDHNTVTFLWLLF